MKSIIWYFKFFQLRYNLSRYVRDQFLERNNDFEEVSGGNASEEEINIEWMK